MFSLWKLSNNIIIEINERIEDMETKRNQLIEFENKQNVFGRIEKLFECIIIAKKKKYVICF